MAKKEYVKDSSGRDKYNGVLDAVYQVEDPEMLELIERFARRLICRERGAENNE